MASEKWFGQPHDRLDGPEKVTGAAKYAGDYHAEGLLYGYVVNSTITKGKIIKLDTAAALGCPGVEAVFTHENRPKLAWFNIQYADMDAPPGQVFMPLHNEAIVCNGQPIALVVADTFETARYAASLLDIVYDPTEFSTDLMANIGTARAPKKGLATALKPPPPKPTGDFEKAFNQSPNKATGEFFHGTEHHNPLELFATTTIYEGKGKLTIYDKTQGTINSQLYVGNVFGLHYKNVRVIAPYVGGAFGAGLRPQYQLFMSVMAALELKRPVRVTLTRAQMFTYGHRPPTLQQTAFGADNQGMLTAMQHQAWGETSQFEDYTEMVVNWAHMLYPAPNTNLQYKIVPLDVYSPMDMRAPGGCTGLHAIETTMDELSYAAGIDPLRLRLQNYTMEDPSSGKPYTSKALKECYEQGAEKFGWKNRLPLPRSMRKGNKLVGYGMATGIWDAMQVPARAEAVITSEGKLIIKNAVTDIGTGTRTILMQIAADEMGLQPGDIEFQYADSRLPFAPIQGGSFTTATVGAAIKGVCVNLKKKLFKLAQQEQKFAALSFAQVGFANGGIYVGTTPTESLSFAALVTANKNQPVKASKFALPAVLKLRKYARATHSAAFVEVEVDEELGTINVTRALTAVAAGKIINPKTARSQILGGMVWSISKALREETITDHRLGKYMNANLGEYHIPVHADIHDLDVLFVEENDSVINELGVKGLGEIGLVAMPAAITNAIYHATGKRINHLPIHFDELLVD